MTSDKDRQLLADYRGGDAGAVGEVYSWIKRIVLSKSWDRSLPVDQISDEVQAAVYEKVSDGTFKARVSFRSYVNRTALNICVSWIRRKYRKPSLVSLDDIPEPSLLEESPLDDIVEKERKGLLIKAYDALCALAAPECRDVWRMVYVECLRYEEIATRLGISEGTVKSRMHRCREKARKARSAIERVLGIDFGEDLEL